MTVFENLQMGAFSRGGEPIDDDVARVFDLFPRLKERRTQKAGTLSGGEQQMLAIGPRADGAAHRPAARRALDGPLADPDRADLRDHHRDQRPGHDRAAGGAERADGAQHREPRLRAADRADHPRRHCGQPAPPTSRCGRPTSARSDGRWPAIPGRRVARAPASATGPTCGRLLLLVVLLMVVVAGWVLLGPRILPPTTGRAPTGAPGRPLDDSADEPPDAATLELRDGMFRLERRCRVRRARHGVGVRRR